MNKAITEGLVLMPPPFSAGLNLWSRDDGLTGQGSYLAQANAAFVPSDQDFGGCLELTKTLSHHEAALFSVDPVRAGAVSAGHGQGQGDQRARCRRCGLRAGPGNSSGGNVSSAQQIGPSMR